MAISGGKMAGKCNIAAGWRGAPDRCQASRSLSRFIRPSSQHLTGRGQAGRCLVNEPAVVANRVSEHVKKTYRKQEKGNVLRKGQSRTSGSVSAEGACGTAVRATEARPIRCHHLLFGGPVGSSGYHRSSRNATRVSARLAGVVGQAGGTVASTGSAGPNVAIRQGAQTSRSAPSTGHVPRPATA